MPTYLNEDQAGIDSDQIGFPHLLLCQGVVCTMENGSLIGGHFTTKGSDQRVAARMMELINENGGSGAIRSMCVAQNEDVREQHSATISDSLEKARLLGFKGEVKLLDTAAIKPKDGTYVQVTSQGLLDDPTIEYKRNEKMAFAPGVPGPLPPNIKGYGNHTVRADLGQDATILHLAKEKDLQIRNAGNEEAPAVAPAARKTRDSIKLGSTSSSSVHGHQNSTGNR